MKKLLFLLILLNAFQSKAQLSPPGLGDGKAGSWMAVGVNQDLKDDKSITATTYFGVGRKSDYTDYNLVEMPSIVVINQEFYHKLNSNLKVSYALSYRNQQEIKLNKETNIKDKITKQEVRAYGRLAYSFKSNNIKYTQTIREDIRKFYDGNWNNAEETLQLRTRFKTQIGFALDSKHIHNMTLGAEALFSSSQEVGTHDWSKFKYNESRFTLFYTLKPKEMPVEYSVGYMNNLIEKGDTHAVHYAAVSVVWNNLF